MADSHLDRSGWTGGQASLLRWTFGVGLVVYAAMFQPLVWAVPLGALGLLLAVGVQTRWVALASSVALVFAMPFERAWPLTWRTPLPEPFDALPLASLCAAWLAVWPRAPYGSLEAAGRDDPRGGWRLGRRFDGAWIAWGLFCLLAAYGIWSAERAHAKLEPQFRDILALPDGALPPSATSRVLGGYEWSVVIACVAIALTACFRRVRPIGWFASLALVVGLFCLSSDWIALASLAWLLLALFDPAWIPAKRGDVELFYDGDCALCQGFTRLAIAEDRHGDVYFGSQSGETYAREVGDRAAEFPDSVVVRERETGEIRLCSDAVLRLLGTLGGLWRVAGWVVWLVPRPLRDAGYAAVARIRRRLGVKPSSACPFVDEALLRRFLA